MVTDIGGDGSLQFYLDSLVAKRALPERPREAEGALPGGVPPPHPLPFRSARAAQGGRRRSARGRAAPSPPTLSLWQSGPGRQKALCRRSAVPRPRSAVALPSLGILQFKNKIEGCQGNGRALPCSAARLPPSTAERALPLCLPRTAFNLKLKLKARAASRFGSRNPLVIALGWRQKVSSLPPQSNQSETS